MERLRDPLHPGRLHERRDLLREHQDRRREDRRDDAGRVDLQRQVAGLAAHDLSPDHAFGVLDGYSSLPAFEEDDDGDDQHDEHADDGQVERGDVAGLRLREHADGGVGHVGDDAREDDQRDAVAYPALGDLLAEPHDEGGAGRQRDHRQQAERPPWIGDHLAELRVRAVVTFQPARDEERLDQRQDDAAVARVLVQPPPPHLPFLLDLLQLGDDDRQQLQDDRRAMNRDKNAYLRITNIVFKLFRDIFYAISIISMAVLSSSKYYKCI